MDFGKILATSGPKVDCFKKHKSSKKTKFSRKKIWKNISLLATAKSSKTGVGNTMIAYVIACVLSSFYIGNHGITHDINTISLWTIKSIQFTWKTENQEIYKKNGIANGLRRK